MESFQMKCTQLRIWLEGMDDAIGVFFVIGRLVRLLQNELNYVKWEPRKYKIK